MGKLTENAVQRSEELMSIGNKMSYEALEEQNMMLHNQLHHKTNQTTIEFNRYKQDCRKRALDLAHHELVNLTAASSASKGGEINVTELADKYYNWLISIEN